MIAFDPWDDDGKCDHPDCDLNRGHATSHLDPEGKWFS